MSSLTPILTDPVARLLFWSAVTIGLYGLAKRLYRKWPRGWLAPVAVAPILIATAILALRGTYQDYIHGTRWLVLMLGPVTVAFGIPIYEQRALIRRHWPVLLAGMAAGTLASLLSSWGLATLVGLDGTLRLSLLPRSISTPFAMEVSSDIGGAPDLTAVFVVVTGLAGALMGDLILARLPIVSSLARGALFGLGAHGIGTARAIEIGEMEGAISGLVMVLVGVLNVLAAPLVGRLLN